jgi:hypothetical protein
MCAKGGPAARAYSGALSGGAGGEDGSAGFAERGAALEEPNFAPYAAVDSSDEVDDQCARICPSGPQTASGPAELAGCFWQISRLSWLSLLQTFVL